MIRQEDKGGQRRAGHKRNNSAADGLIDIIEFLTLASIPEGQGPVSPTRNSFHEINRLAARFVPICTRSPRTLACTTNSTDVNISPVPSHVQAICRTPTAAATISSTCCRAVRSVDRGDRQ